MIYKNLRGFLLSIVALLWVVSAAFGQIQQAPPVKVPQQAPPVRRQLTYSELALRAAVEKKSFVRFVNCAARDITGCLSVSVGEYNGSSKPRIIVTPVGATWGGVLSSDATDADIRGVGEVSRKAPPFRRLRAGEVPTADGDEDISGRLTFLKDLVPYEPAKNTQTTFRRRTGYIAPSPRTELKAEWQVPGGMVGTRGWSSRLLKSRDTVPSVYLVRQDPSDMSSAITWGRTYPDDSVFADVLRNADGIVFEVRGAEKVGGEWRRFVAYRNDAARPIDYVRPTSRQCMECHNSAGRSEYAGAAIPGSDTILSDPFDVLESGQSVQGGFGLSLR